MIEFYNITERGAFYIKIEECKDIINLTDSFITIEKLKEMTGESHYFGYDSKVYLPTEIRSACEEWADMIPPNAMCTSKTTPRIKTLLNECEPYIIRQHIQRNYTVRGRRIINSEKQQKRNVELDKKEQEHRAKEIQIKRDAPYIRDAEQPIETDFEQIIYAAKYISKEKYHISFSDYTAHKNSEVIIFCKRLFNWDEIAKRHRCDHHRKFYSQDLIHMKTLWDNPTFLDH